MRTNKDYRNSLRDLGLSDDEASLVIRTKQQAKHAGTIRLEVDEDSKEAEVLIYDTIGMDWFGEGVTAKSITETLKEHGALERITVRINSPGGDAFDGIAIYNILKLNEARVEVEIDGLAASAASIIAMAGDEIRIAENAMMMIHDAWALAMGDSTDMLAMAALLEKLDGQIAGVYAARSGRRPETFRNLMDQESWFTGEEAVSNRLATKVIPNKKAAAMAFDLSGFKNAPALGTATVRVDYTANDVVHTGSMSVGSTEAFAIGVATTDSVPVVAGFATPKPAPEAVAARTRVLELDEETAK
jgi:ATP-dependent protease ClpP protease subunit